MKELSTEITRLCESWWGKLADATRMEQQVYVRRLLDLLDWEQPLPFSPKPAAEALGAATYLLRGDGQSTVAAYFLPPGVLDPPSSMVERCLDFCFATRLLVEETRSPAVHYVLITDLSRTYLYDARTEELLVWADDPRGFNDVLGTALRRGRVLHGSLDDLRRQPRSAVARGFREWSQRWMDSFAMRGRLDESVASLAIDRLCVIRFLIDHDIMRRTRARLLRRFQDLVTRAAMGGGRESGCGRDLVKLFHDMWLDWRIDLFAHTPELDGVLERDEVAVPWLREAMLLARHKFTIATILESFNHGDPAEKMRVRMVPDDNEAREKYLARQTLESIDAARITVDLAEEGYRSVLHWFDRVVGLYDRLNLDFDRHSRHAAAGADALDLFAWSEIDAQRPAACADRLAHACDHGLGIYYSDARQLRIARLLLTLHLILRYSERHEPVDRMPGLDKVLQQRPRVLTAENVLNAKRVAVESLDLDDY